ncbi:MAG: AbrB/MazE/SpoVT family DNA-binding domain-containing protein [Nanoarchaeota archaeon]
MKSRKQIKEVEIDGVAYVKKRDYLETKRELEQYKGSIPGQVKKWGNSAAIRIPKKILQEAGVKENDRVIIMSQQQKIILERT